MALKFKYEIYSSGWVQVNPVSEFGTFVKSRGDINPAIERNRIDSSIMLIGDDYDLVIALFPTEYVNRWVQYRISQYISGSYQVMIEGICNIDTNIDSNRESLVLNKFSNLNDKYDIILNNYSNEWSIYGRGLPEYRVKIEEESTIFAIHATPGNGLTQANYKTLYTVNGNPNLSAGLTPDPRWAYFLFSHTIGADEHVYVTMGYDYIPDPSNGVITYTWNYITLSKFYIGAGGTTLINNVYQKLWVDLPPTTTTTTTIYNPICFKGLQIIDIINELLDIIDSSLNFNSSTGISYTGHTGTPTFNIDDLFICEPKEIFYYANLDAKMSLKKIFEWFEKMFDLYWYLDGNELKFIHRTELATSGTLNLTSETEHLKQTELIEGNVPTYEKFSFKDSVGLWSVSSNNKHPFGTLEITYLPNTSQLNGFRSMKETLVDLNTNTKVMAQNSGVDEIDGFILLNADFSALSGFTLPLEHNPSLTMGYGYDQNLSFTASNMFAFTNKSRYGEDADLTDRLKVGWVPILDIEPKPLYKQTTIDYVPTVRLDLFDMNQAVTTSLGTTQAIELSHDLNSGNAQLTVEL